MKKIKNFFTPNKIDLLLAFLFGMAVALILDVLLTPLPQSSIQEQPLISELPIECQINNITIN